MSLSGILSSSFSTYDTQNGQSSGFQQVRQEFQQLGQDLQAGNLSAAQSDFATLQQLRPQNNSSSAGQSASPIAQAFSQLAQDLQSGNLAGAQQDYTAIQQAFQNQSQQGQQGAEPPATEGHHHHHGGGGEEASAITQTLEQLGQALQAGDLSDAQQAYSSLQQDFQALGQNNGAQAQPSSISVNG